MSDIVCPKCGRSSSQVEFIEAFCVDCYPVRIKLPHKVELEQCTRCEKVRMRGEWVAYNPNRIAEFVLSKCKGGFTSAEYDLEGQEATFTVAGGAAVRRTIYFELKKTICQNCSRMSGGYYQAIIQLRGSRTRMLGTADMLVQKLGRRTFITKVDEKDEGIDLYVGNSKIVLEMLKALGIKATMTKKLVGREQGKRLYRTTFLVRL